MAAPHVSAAIALALSVKPSLRGKPDDDIRLTGVFRRTHYVKARRPLDGGGNIVNAATCATQHTDRQDRYRPIDACYPKCIVRCGRTDGARNMSPVP